MVQTFSPSLETNPPINDRHEGRSIFMASELVSMYFTDLMPEGYGVVSQTTDHVSDQHIAETVILDVRNRTASDNDEIGWQHTKADPEGMIRSRLKVNRVGQLFGWQVVYNRAGQIVSKTGSLSDPEIKSVWSDTYRHKINMMSHATGLIKVKESHGRAYTSFLLSPVVEITEPKEFISRNAEIIREHKNERGEIFTTIRVRLHDKKREEEAKRRHDLWKGFGVTALKPIEYEI